MLHCVRKRHHHLYLRVGTINDLFEFDWEPLLQELQEKAPLLSVLKAASERSNRKPADVAVVGMAAAILLKESLYAHVQDANDDLIPFVLWACI